MTKTLHFGVTLENVQAVFENVHGADTDGDSWHVWGERYNSIPRLLGADAVHFTYNVCDDEDSLHTLVTELYSADIPLVEMRDMHSRPIGHMIVRTDAIDWAEDVSSWHKDGLASYHHIRVLTSDANYFDPETLDPITDEWLDHHAHDQEVMNAALTDREILNRTDAMFLAISRDKSGPFAK